jgi:hypothetical protein
MYIASEISFLHFMGLPLSHQIFIYYSIIEMRPVTFLLLAVGFLLILLIISAIARTDGFITGSSPYILSGMGMSDATGMGGLGKSERRSYCQKCCDSGPMTCDPAYQCGDC